VTRALRHGAAAAALFALPLVLLVTGSLREPGAPPPLGPELLPDPLSVGGYGRAFELVDLARYTANSLAVCALAVPLAVLVASWAGFAVSQVPRRAAVAVVAVSFAALMVPATPLLVPRFALFSALGPTPGRRSSRPR
jgi:multiple sugar transport system permease protein